AGGDGAENAAEKDAEDFEDEPVVEGFGVAGRNEVADARRRARGAEAFPHDEEGRQQHQAECDAREVWIPEFHRSAFRVSSRSAARDLLLVVGGFLAALRNDTGHLRSRSTNSAA